MFESCRPLPPGLVWRSNELVGFRTAPRIEPFRRVASGQIKLHGIRCDWGPQYIAERTARGVRDGT